MRDMLKSGLEEKRENFNRKFYIYAATLRNFSSGVEISIINPSLWFYLAHFHVSNTFFGFVLCLYQLTGIFSSVFFGRLYDKTRRTRKLAIVANTFEIVGNAVFSLGFSKYLVLFGRMICGVGEGFTSVVYAEVGSVFVSSERLKVISLLEGGRVVGSIVGPLFNLAFVHVDVHIGKWHITYGATAGLVMVIIWIMVTILCGIYIYDMYIMKMEKEKLKKTVTFAEEIKGSSIESEDELIYDPQSSLLQNNDTNGGAGGIGDRTSYNVDIRDAIKELTTVEPMIVMLADALFWLTFGSYTSITPLLLATDIHWDPTHVTIVYLVFGVVVALSIVMLQFLPKTDDVTLLVSLSIAQGFIALLNVLYQIERGNETAMVVVIMTIVVLVAAFAGGSLVIGRSLLTKLICVKNQGLAQGIYNVWIGLALSLGPLIGSAAAQRLEIWGAIAALAYFIIAANLYVFRHQIRERQEKYIDNK